MSGNGLQAEVSALGAAPADKGPAWLGALRTRATARFRELGLPSTRREDWRYTSVAPIARTAFAPAAALPAGRPADRDLDGYRLWDPLALRLVFVDGRLSPEHSQLSALPAGVRVRSLAEVLRDEPDRLEGILGSAADFDERAFVALNTALHAEGAVVELGPGAVVGHPIHLLHLFTRRPQPQASHFRALILAGAGSRATVVETHAGPEGGVYLQNTVTELLLGEGASVDHYKDQEESPGAFHVGFLAARLERNASFRSHVLSLGGRLTRNETAVQLLGAGAECELKGLYVASGDQHCDNQTFVDHAVPACTSREAYRGVLDGRSRGVFNGRVLVRPDAQGTSAQQQNKNLLLSGLAHVDTKPQLEIFADDVQCSHGATVGQLDPDAVFYLRSRGIGEAAARSLLTRAFAGAITGGIQVAPLRCRIDQILFRRLDPLAAPSTDRDLQAVPG